MTGLRLFILAGGVLAGTLAHPRSPGPRPLQTAPRLSPAVQHTSWRIFYPAIPDTITLRFADDSSAIVSSTGVPILQSTYKLKNDIITFHDYGGMNSCNDLTGSYHVKINGDTLVLVMDEDPCDARGGMLILKPWIRSH